MISEGKLIEFSVELYSCSLFFAERVVDDVTTAIIFVLPLVVVVVVVVVVALVTFSREDT